MKQFNESSYCNQQHNDNEIEELAIANDLCSDADDSSKSVYSDATDPYYLPTEADLLKALNKILGTNTIWDFALQPSWFNQDHESKKIKVFCPCRRSHKKWLEEQGRIDFFQ